MVIRGIGKTTDTAKSGPADMEPRRILVAGDVHMDYDWAHELIEIALQERCEAIVQLGDLGYMPRWRDGALFLKNLDLRLGETGLVLAFCDGNHDDHDALAKLQAWAEGPIVRARPSISYLPRGTRFMWHGVRFLAVGGAYSIDRDWRLDVEQRALAPRTLYWSEEVLSEEDVRRASLEGATDVLLAHDCPAGVAISGIRPDYPEAEENRRQLARVVDATRPRWGLLHGHYHVRSDGIYRNRLLQLEVPTIGLAHEHTGRDGWLVLDLNTLRLALDTRKENS